MWKAEEKMLKAVVEAKANGESREWKPIHK
jgi:hypothetical protein